VAKDKFVEGKRFVLVPSDRFMEMLRDIGSKVRDKGGTMTEEVHGDETVVNIRPPRKNTIVRVYTSIAQGRRAVRECGDDAVRVVVGYMVESKRMEKIFVFKPITKGRSIYRTAPTKLPEEERVATFLNRLRDAIRESYAEASKWTSCQHCNSPMTLRANKSTGNSFYGCTGYPVCLGTKPYVENQA
jgi:hypothetical protein